MGDIVDLHGRSIPIEDDELVENLARFADGTLSEVAVKARHHLSNEEWAALGESDRWSSGRGLQAPPDTHRRHQKGTRAD